MSNENQTIEQMEKALTEAHEALLKIKNANDTGLTREELIKIADTAVKNAGVGGEQ